MSTPISSTTACGTDNTTVMVPHASDGSHLPAELKRMIFSVLSTSDILIYCRGVHPILSTIANEELAFRHRNHFEPVLRNSDAVLEVMRTCNAVLVGPAALAFFLGLGSSSSYSFVVPYPHHEMFMNFLMSVCCFRCIRELNTHQNLADYCRSSPRSRFAGMERIVYFERTTGGRVMQIIVAVTGRQGLHSVASFPVAFQSSTLQFNYLTADGVLSAYPTLTLFRRSLFHIHRINNCNTPLAHYARYGIDFRIRPENWDRDRNGTEAIGLAVERATDSQTRRANEV
ncbi:hypothetical protein K466DRAFT_566879 [Polyporus arcularius HHB13444]|uniref:Uncharacterized protein n=1 Tax=Polyporus arcularius HHB13444 TaxID=1314778 RepID=A0A5C3P5R1_9APHY|nr:hypothetical protein K466DRAFT_566879 [Polyporus arcularius HHB13444]